MFENVKLEDWKRAFRHDCREIAGHTTHWVEWRIRYGYRAVTRLFDHSDELPF